MEVSINVIPQRSTNENQTTEKKQKETPEQHTSDTLIRAKKLTKKKSERNKETRKTRKNYESSHILPGKNGKNIYKRETEVGTELSYQIPQVPQT